MMQYKFTLHVFLLELTSEHKKTITRIEWEKSIFLLFIEDVDIKELVWIE